MMATGVAEAFDETKRGPRMTGASCVVIFTTETIGPLGMSGASCIAIIAIFATIVTEKALLTIDSWRDDGGTTPACGVGIRKSPT